MDSLRIAAKADALIRKFGTNDPLLIAEGMNITILPVPFETLKGCFRRIKRNSFIFLNENLSIPETRCVVGHEIGHCCLHQQLAGAKSGLLEYSLFDMKSRPELEANLFGAELTVPEEDLLEYIFSYGYTCEQAAKAMGIPQPYVALKIEILRARGYEIYSQEYDRDFLRK